jgi:hypothetical protein
MRACLCTARHVYWWLERRPSASGEGAAGVSVGRALADVAEITSAWCTGATPGRLVHRLGRRRKAEAKARYYALHRGGRPATLDEGCMMPGMLHLIRKKDG